MRLIDANEFEKTIDKCVRYGNTALIDKYEVLHKLRDTSTIDVEPVRHGKWLRHRESLVYVTECSVCGHKYYNPVLQSPGNYCSNCGSKNVGGEPNET